MISYCENCEQTKKDLNETKQKLVEFQNLAKKIVQTDLILRKYSDKERECEKLSGDLRKKDYDFDHLNDKYKNLLKEIETFKKQNKEYSKEKAQLEQNLKQKDELIASFGQKESEFELKLNSYAQNERLLENKTNNYLKQIEDLKNELKILNEKHEKTVQQLNLETVQETPSFALNNIRTSTQILNVNFKESSESSPAQLELPKRETTFFLGSESENEETDAKPALQKDISLSQDGSESMNISLSEKPEISNQPQDSREIKFSHAKEESNAKSLDKQILDITSSLESSGSESDSDSESSICSSSVASSQVSEKSKSVFNTKDLFGSELSDEENDNQKDKSVDITNIQEEFAQSQQKDAEEAEILENRIEHLTDQYMDYMQQKTIDELIEVSIEEQLILELFFDQFLNEETSSKSYLAANILENVCTVCIEEERDERKQMEKKLRDEIRIKLEEEISEKIFDEKINQLMLECSQRVLAEAKNEQVDLMYKSIVDQVCKENIEKCLMELLFDDMLSVPKPMIEKLEFKIQKETEYRSNKRRFPVDFSLMEEKGKRSRKESGGSESSWKSSLAFVEDTDKKTLEECKVFSQKCSNF
ncbi:hypothetical protein BpHYR1_027199 [Brachionus plicatilis]|uniref:Uncharacterized protein n=1 Tax=Brachionus plicatilis TaxID=10195 RepID=A0A3M7P770_BRAPC|nr:hypothetical protein BpHYR1_027199 [Brachionus plicatilis]